MKHLVQGIVIVEIYCCYCVPFPDLIVHCENLYRVRSSDFCRAAALTLLGVGPSWRGCRCPTTQIQWTITTLANLINSSDNLQRPSPHQSDGPGHEPSGSKCLYGVYFE
eukprot:scaffold1007_cov142-Cylindrotheca_fusiformis.AAC.2